MNKLVRNKKALIEGCIRSIMCFLCILVSYYFKSFFIYMVTIFFVNDISMIFLLNEIRRSDKKKEFIIMDGFAFILTDILLSIVMNQFGPMCLEISIRRYFTRKGIYYLFYLPLAFCFMLCGVRRVSKYDFFGKKPIDCGSYYHYYKGLLLKLILLFSSFLLGVFGPIMENFFAIWYLLLAVFIFIKYCKNNYAGLSFSVRRSSLYSAAFLAGSIGLYFLIRVFISEYYYDQYLYTIHISMLFFLFITHLAQSILPVLWKE